MESISESERTFTTLILGGGPETLVLLLEALKHSKFNSPFLTCLIPKNP